MIFLTLYTKSLLIPNHNSSLVGWGRSIWGGVLGLTFLNLADDFDRFDNELTFGVTAVRCLLLID